MNHPLRKYREQHGLTQGQLAKKLGVSRQMVGLIESGEREITAENAVEWEGELDIPRAKLRPDIFEAAA